VTTSAAERLAALASTLDVSAMLPSSQVSGAVAGASHTHVWNETPSGVVDGANGIYTLAAIPSPAGSLLLFRNGLLMRAGAGNDYTLVTLTITFLQGNLPAAGDILLASYTT
jgi:hypothetical protein